MSAEKFRVYIDRDLENLIPDYIGSIKSNIDKIQALLGEHNMESIRLVGHNMKGSGGGYGFDKISEIGAVIENGAKMGDQSAIIECIEILKYYLDNVVVEFVESE